MVKLLTSIAALALPFCLSSQPAERPLTVDELFSIGTENSVRLRASLIDESISEQRQAAARTGRMPDIQIGVSAGYIGQPVIFKDGLSHPSRPDAPDWSQNYNIEILQPFYQGGKIRHTIRQSDIQREIASLATEDGTAAVKMALLQKYMSLFSYYKQREVLVRNIEESQRRLEDIGRMRREGLVTRNDEIRSELQLTNDRLAYNQADNNIAIASQQIDILLGLEENVLIVPDTSLLYTSMTLMDYDSYLTAASINYPGMRIARRNTMLAENDTRIIRANYLPSLSLRAGNTLARPISSSMTDKFSNNWTVGLTLSYRLSSLYQNRHRLNEARHVVALRNNAEEQVLQELKIYIKDAYLSHKEALDMVDALKLSVRQSEENYRIVHNRYMNQLSILTDLLDASRIRLDAELQLTVARVQAVYTYYELQRACGNL